METKLFGKSSRWIAADWEREESPLLIRFRTELQVDFLVSQLKYFQLFVSYVPENEAGFPDEKTAEEIEQIEDGLLDYIDKQSNLFLYCIITGFSRVEWFLCGEKYLDQPELASLFPSVQFIEGSPESLHRYREIIELYQKGSLELYED